MFYNRLTQGDIDGASEVVKCLGNIAEISGCKTLVMIARASLCEIYLINDQAEKLSEEISQIEMIMGMLGRVRKNSDFKSKVIFFLKNKIISHKSILESKVKICKSKFASQNL